MKTLSTLLLWVLLISPASAAEMDLLAQMKGLTGLFDQGGVDMPLEGFIPSVPVPQKKGQESGDQMPAWPDMNKSGPVYQNWLSYKDAFTSSGEACMIVDIVYVRQPSLKEAVKALAPCLQAVSKAYKTALAAVEGDKKIVIAVSGVLAEGNTLLTDVEHALKIRKGSLLPVNVVVAEVG